MNSNPRIVLDTNVLLVSISSRSEYHWIFQKLIKEEFDLVISNDILSEYEEIVSNKYSPKVAISVLRTLLLLPNVERTEIYYKWDLIDGDKDDNKFVDCAIAANVDYIVTNDKDFNRLKEIDFPPLKIMDISGFKELFG
jgi:uncharacterized protein